jgi:DNA-directed RNA polymerase specialized sigma24 family protein
MAEPGSVTVWIARLRDGDPAAAERLWQGYYRRLVELARRHLRGRPRASADEEDVALNAFDSFFRGAAEGRFPRLSDRDDLWQVLVMLTARKAWRQIRHDRRGMRGMRGMRGGGAVQHLSALAEGAVEVIGTDPTPEFAAQVADEYRHRLERLEDEELRAVAVARMEGYTNAEVAERLGVAVCTVERRLKLIRKLWQGVEGEAGAN